MTTPDLLTVTGRLPAIRVGRSFRVPADNIAALLAGRGETK